MKINFDKASHEYRVDGVLFPSVTQILESGGLSDFSMVPRDALEYAQWKGTLIHKTLEIHDIDGLDPEWLTDDPNGVIAQPYVKAWDNFKSKYSIDKFDGVEIRGVSTQYGFAGTMDRYLGREIWDIKTGGVSKSWGPQLAGYEQIAKEMKLNPNVRNWQRRVVQLDGKGFKVFKFADRMDFNAFRACQVVHNYKHKKGA